jgi:hypothetical protein
MVLLHSYTLFKQQAGGLLCVCVVSKEAGTSKIVALVVENAELRAALAALVCWWFLRLATSQVLTLRRYWMQRSSLNKRSPVR